MKSYKVLAVSLAIALLLSLVQTGVSRAAPSTPSSAHPVGVAHRGTTNFSTTAQVSLQANQAAASSAAAVSNEVRKTIELEIPRNSASANGTGPSPVPVLPMPVTVPNPLSTKPGESFDGWKGITHYDQRNANNGNQFSSEPPDQALCAGGGYVLEAVNSALALYNTKGKMKLGVTDINTFFDYPAAIDRVNLRFGPEVTDPRCIFDLTSQRWFLTILTLDVDPASGAFTGGSHVDLAVSKTSDPSGDWYLYSLFTTNGNGTVPGHPGCPCLGDQPLMGMDANALFITTNEFAFSGADFNGAQVYVLPKTPLLAGQAFNALTFDRLTSGEGPAYSMQPAIPGSASSVETAADGTEYFLSALDYNASLDNRIALWALTGTNTLGSAAPTLALNYTLLTTETYGQPPSADQKNGKRPLGDKLHEGLPRLETNDDRMNQVAFVGGKLYAALNTVIHMPGEQRAGIAYFVVSPAVADAMPSGTIADQGYVAVKGNNVMFPAVAATANGDALMTFTLSGQDFYPSAAYVRLGAGQTVHIAGRGVAPADGFSAYVAYGGNGVERWGDYSGAAVDGNTIWMATEYIPGGPRTDLANWGTFVFHVTP